jgi:hypothetical protein
MNRVNIVVKKLSGFRCNKGNRCGKESLEYLEIKYRADKTATGRDIYLLNKIVIFFIIKALEFAALMTTSITLMRSMVLTF